MMRSMMRYGGIIVELNEPLGVAGAQRVLEAIRQLRDVKFAGAVDFDCGDDKTTFEHALGYSEELQ